ncbi:MAG TPA: VOC family protein [Steroidobacteraceae bacterium]|nr:VOC family protein [Steroidobacteraceae bacterium]
MSPLKVMASLFGPVMQNGFVVADLTKALEHWTRVMRVGPFFLFERIAFAECWYRDRPATDIDLSVAIAYWGDIQIELIQQRNDVPSIYTDFTSRGLAGLQHMGVITDSVERDLSRLAEQGVRPVQHGRTAAGMRFAYVDTDHHPGGMVELIEAGPKGLAFFEKMREAARTWDGTKPVRPVG